MTVSPYCADMGVMQLSLSRVNADPLIFRLLIVDRSTLQYLGGETGGSRATCHLLGTILSSST